MKTSQMSNFLEEKKGIFPSNVINLIEENEDEEEFEVEKTYEKKVEKKSGRYGEFFEYDDEIEANGLIKRKRKGSRSESKTGDGLYEAEEIIGKRKKKGKIYYKVKWKGYPVEESTWELHTNFTNSSLELLNLFEKKRRVEKIERKKERRELLKNGLKNTETNQENSKIENLEPRSAKSEKRFSKRIFRLNQKRPEENEYGLPYSSNTNSEDSDEEEYSRFGSASRNSFTDLSPYTESSESSSKKSDNNPPAHLIHFENLQKLQKNSENKEAFISYIDNPQGDIKYDKIKRIISAQIIDTKDVELSCLCEFEQRPNGLSPDPRRYSSKLVRYYAPQCLIDFFQSRICFNNRSI